MSSARLFAVGFAACAAAMVPALAQAQSPIIVESVPRGVPMAFVRYGDLNLAHPVGVARLYGRVHRAARMLCVDRGVRDLRRAMEGRRCMTFALGNAQISMNRAISYHRARQFAASAY